MARRVQPITLGMGLGAAALVAFLSFGTLLTVALSAERFDALSRFDWAAVRFTVFQAALSAILSVGFAIPWRGLWRDGVFPCAACSSFCWVLRSFCP